jgi:large subunit ribosomal protein L18
MSVKNQRADPSGCTPDPQKIRGSEDRPRLAVHRSEAHIYAQVIDDDAGKTLVAASSRDKE